VRFNHSKVRQNTNVHQHEVTLQYQCNHRSYRTIANLTLDFDYDSKNLTSHLLTMRENLKLIDENPKYFAIENNGTSEVYKKSEYPTSAQLVSEITDVFSDADLAGLLTCGPIRQASLNSKGQFHYFENDQFFFDYSVYDGPRAAKGYYSEQTWDSKAFKFEAQNTKNTLSLLKKNQVKVKPGLYRTYLAPMAVSEIAHLFNWRAVSRGAYEQGFTPLKKLFTKEQLFSPQFSLVENNNLGLNSHFNAQGEICPTEIPIIENGEMKNFLISSTTAKEYNLVSNFAESSPSNNESLRSFEVRAGTLAEGDILKKLGTGLYLTNLHYINWSDPQIARLTGMTRFACFWVENGEIVGPIQDLRFDDSLYNLFGTELESLTEHRSTYINTSTYQKRGLGGMIVPGMLLSKMNFTL
ncbi:MAG: metallopeptidase TldD-related protein, partial [Pseudobdellovibrio sp.]